MINKSVYLGVALEHLLTCVKFQLSLTQSNVHRRRTYTANNYIFPNQHESCAATKHVFLTMNITRLEDWSAEERDTSGHV